MSDESKTTKVPRCPICGKRDWESHTATIACLSCDHVFKKPKGMK
jgi:hypothetical protein